MLFVQVLTKFLEHPDNHCLEVYLEGVGGGFLLIFHLTHISLSLHFGFSVFVSVLCLSVLVWWLYSRCLAGLSVPELGAPGMALVWVSPPVVVESSLLWSHMWVGLPLLMRVDPVHNV